MKIDQFKATIGHEKQKRMFLRALESDRLAHAYVLSGPSQVGKKFFALEFAKIIGALPHFGLLVVSAGEGSSIGIEQIRKAQNHLRLSSVDGSKKVVIVDDAELMTGEAVSAFLKLLEEPPGESLILLITDNHYSLLATIRSRVQRVTFSYNSDQEIRELVTDSAVGRDQIERIVSLAGGRLGLAAQLVGDSEEVEMFDQWAKEYQILTKGTTLERLQTSERLATMESSRLRQMLRFFARSWFEAGGDRRVAEKLVLASSEIGYNLNTKLFFDNLFLP